MVLSSFRINTFIENVDVGDYIVHGDLEAYSCKMPFLLPNFGDVSSYTI
jgi:hypothetical protein